MKIAKQRLRSTHHPYVLLSRRKTDQDLRYLRSFRDALSDTVPRLTEMSRSIDRMRAALIEFATVFRRALYRGVTK